MEMGKLALYKIEQSAHKFKLDVTRVSHNTLQLSSKKYMYDSWLIRREGKRLVLLHLNKQRQNKKCTYHVQKTVDATNWHWLLQKINQHDKYVISHKWNARENMVDRVLNKYNQERGKKCKE